MVPVIWFLSTRMSQMMIVFLMAGCLECRIPPSSWRVIGVPSSL